MGFLTKSAAGGIGKLAKLGSAVGSVATKGLDRVSEKVTDELKPSININLHTNLDVNHSLHLCTVILDEFHSIGEISKYSIRNGAFWIPSVSTASNGKPKAIVTIKEIKSMPAKTLITFGFTEDPEDEFEVMSEAFLQVFNEKAVQFNGKAEKVEEESR